MDIKDIGIIGLRALFIYLFLLVMLRILGKRCLGDLNAFDFIITLVLGRIAAEPILGNVSMLKALSPLW